MLRRYGTAEIVQGYGRPGSTHIAAYGRSQFLGEIGMLTGQRAYLTAVATSAGRILAVPAAKQVARPGLIGACPIKRARATGMTVSERM